MSEPYESKNFLEGIIYALGAIIVSLFGVIWRYTVSRDQVMQMIQDAKPTAKEIGEMITAAIAAYDVASHRLDLLRSENITKEFTGINDKITENTRQGQGAFDMIMEAIKASKEDLRREFQKHNGK